MSKKKIFRNLLISASPLAIALPVLSASCGRKEANPNGYGNIVTEKDASNKDYKTVKTLANIKHNSAFKLASNYTKENAPKAVLVTDAGHVTDKSFNQSGWEAISKISVELGLNDKGGYVQNKDNRNTFVTPESTANLPETYRAQLNAGYKYIILCGFLHNAAIKTFLGDPTNVTLVKTKKPIFIGVDTDIVKEFAAKGLNGYSIDLNFNTKISGYLAGYALADFYSKKYPNAADKDKRTFGTFGGGNFPGVTDFIFGALKGIQAFNKANTGKETRTTANIVNLTSGFNPSVADAQSAATGVKDNNAVFPVAGSLTQLSIQNITKPSSQMIIGVDSDQYYAYETDKNANFFTSALKGVGQAIYTILGQLYSSGDDTFSILNGFKLGVSNATFTTLDDNGGYVGIADQHLKNFSDADKTLAQNAINDSRTNYITNKTMIIADLSNMEGESTDENLINKICKSLNK